MDAYFLGVLEAPGYTVPFNLDPILLDMEGGRYVGPILPGVLKDLITG